MISGRALKFIIIDESDQSKGPYWRHPSSRFESERTRRLLSRFPDQADRIARRTIEAGSPLTKKQTPTVLGGL